MVSHLAPGAALPEGVSLRRKPGSGGGMGPSVGPLPAVSSAPVRLKLVVLLLLFLGLKQRKQVSPASCLEAPVHFFLHGWAEVVQPRLGLKRAHLDAPHVAQVANHSTA